MTSNGGMDRNDLATLSALSDSELSLITCVTQASVVAKNAELDTATTNAAAASLKAKADLAAAAKAAIDKATADAATAKAAADAAILAIQTQAATDQAAAVAAASAPIAGLQQQIADLQAQIAGAKGNRTYPTTTLQEEAFKLEAAKQGTTPEAVWTATVTAAIVPLEQIHTGDIFAAAMTQYPTMTNEQRLAALTPLKLAWVLTIPDVSNQMLVLASKDTGALPAFLALPTDQQNAMLTSMNFV
jgi:hypothetical protein